MGFYYEYVHFVGSMLYGCLIGMVFLLVLGTDADVADIIVYPSFWLIHSFFLTTLLTKIISKICIKMQKLP